MSGNLTKIEGSENPLDANEPNMPYIIMIKIEGSENPLDANEPNMPYIIMILGR